MDIADASGGELNGALYFVFRIPGTIMLQNGSGS
jgi:hypothetical protein